MFLRNIEDSLLTILNHHLDCTMIPDFDNGDEPVEDYGVVGITTVNQVHRGSSNAWSFGEESLKERYKRDFRVLVTLSFYGDTAYQNAFNASSILNMSSALDQLFYDDCVSIIDSTSLRREPELRETKYIDRCTFDLTLLTSQEFVKDSDWFNIVGYQESYPEINLKEQKYVPHKPPNI